MCKGVRRGSAPRSQQVPIGAHIAAERRCTGSRCAWYRLSKYLVNCVCAYGHVRQALWAREGASCHLLLKPYLVDLLGSLSAQTCSVGLATLAQGVKTMLMGSQCYAHLGESYCEVGEDRLLDPSDLGLVACLALYLQIWGLLRYKWVQCNSATPYVPSRPHLKDLSGLDRRML